MWEERPHPQGLLQQDQSNPEATREPNAVHVAEEVAPDVSHEYIFLFPVWESTVSPLQTTVTINNKDVHMEMDTGASLTVISETTLAEIWKPNQVPPLQPTKVWLSTCIGSEIPGVGTVTLKVQNPDQLLELPLIAIAGLGPSLLSRDWLAKN